MCNTPFAVRFTGVKERRAYCILIQCHILNGHGDSKWYCSIVMSRNPWMFLNLKDQQLSNEQSKQVCEIPQIHEWLAHGKKVNLKFFSTIITNAMVMAMLHQTTFFAIKCVANIHWLITPITWFWSCYFILIGTGKTKHLKIAFTKGHYLRGVTQIGKLGENITPHVFKWENGYHLCISI